MYIFISNEPALLAGEWLITSCFVKNKYLGVLGDLGEKILLFLLCS